MPLSLTRRGKIWYIRGTVRGQSCYETTGTSDETLAEGYRITREKELYDQAVFGARATVSFQRATVSYLQHQERSEGQKAFVAKLVAHFAATPVSSIDQLAADKAVSALLAPTAKPSTKRRNVLGPLAAILHHAARRGWCDHPSFDLPKVKGRRLRWLAPSEALALEEAAAPHLRPLIRFCLCTGARLSEALYLDWRQVDLASAHVLFLPDRTKASKLRKAGLTPAAIAALSALPHREGRVFRRDAPKGTLGPGYADRSGRGGGQIKNAWHTACRRAGLGEWDPAPTADDPEAQRFRANARPHDLRHTWATWFYAASKDSLLLKDEGGWASLGMVERYAHMMPANLAPQIATIWGPSHPRIGDLPVVPRRAESVQSAG